MAHQLSGRRDLIKGMGVGAMGMLGASALWPEPARASEDGSDEGLAGCWILDVVFSTGAPDERHVIAFAAGGTLTANAGFNPRADIGSWEMTSHDGFKFVLIAMLFTDPTPPDRPAYNGVAVVRATGTLLDANTMQASAVGSVYDKCGNLITNPRWTGKGFRVTTDGYVPAQEC